MLPSVSVNKLLLGVVFFFFDWNLCFLRHQRGTGEKTCFGACDRQEYSPSRTIYYTILYLQVHPFSPKLVRI